ncbi:copia protein, partial [Filobasidium floriforme]|uniref:copia protein n=1 Tax=Filobasidium floriforme TaxID=5210 RepID=UPI001E8DC006
MDDTRTILHQSGLTKGWWGYAAKSAVYTRNRVPHSAVPEQTPFEKWFGVKPTYKDLRAFGAQLYKHNPTKTRTKLQDKGSKGVLIGYGD